MEEKQQILVKREFRCRVGWDEAITLQDGESAAYQKYLLKVQRKQHR